MSASVDDKPRMMERAEVSSPWHHITAPDVYVGSNPGSDSLSCRNRVDIIVDGAGFCLRLHPTADEARALAALLVQAAEGCE